MGCLQAKVFRVLRYALLIYHVELIALVFFGGYAVFTAAAFPAFFDKVCLTHGYSSSECAQLTNSEEAGGHSDSPIDKAEAEAIHIETARWQMFQSLATFCTSSVSAVFFGSFGDKYGWRIPILFSISTMVCYQFIFALFVSLGESIPIWAFLLLGAFQGIGGSLTLFILCQFSYAANIVQALGGENVPDRLTLRYTVLTAFWSLAYVLFEYAAGALLLVFDYVTTMVVGTAVLTVSFFVALLLYDDDVQAMVAKARLRLNGAAMQAIDSAPTMPDTLQHDSVDVKGMNSVLLTSTEVIVVSVSESPPDSPKLSEVSFCTSAVGSFKEMYVDAYHTITRKRDGNLRLYLVLIVSLFVIYGSEDDGLTAVLSLYVFDKPLQWTPSMLTIYFGTQSFAQMSGSLVGATVLKYFHFQDCSIAIVGMMSAAAKMLLTALSTETWMMYLGIALGCLSTVGYPAMRSFIVNIGEEEETGQLISTITVTSGLAPVFSALVYNNIYSETLKTIGWPGFVFAFTAGLMLVCTLVLVGVYVDSWRYTKRVEKVRAQTDISVVG